MSKRITNVVDKGFEREYKDRVFETESDKENENAPTYQKYEADS